MQVPIQKRNKWKSIPCVINCWFCGIAMSPPEFNPTPAKNIKVTVLVRTFEKIQV
jgi:hypothetical protein